MTGELIGSTASTVVVGVIGLSLLDKLNPQDQNSLGKVLTELKRGDKSATTVAKKTDIPKGKVTRLLNQAVTAKLAFVTNRREATWRYSLTKAGRDAQKAL